MLHCFVAEPLMYQCLSLKSPVFQSNAAHLPLLLPTRPLHLIHIENERWAHATHILTKGRLGLLLQGSDRLEPQARFPSTVNPSLAMLLILLKSHLFMHKCVKEVEPSSRDTWLALEVIKKRYIRIRWLWLFIHCYQQHATTNYCLILEATPRMLNWTVFIYSSPCSTTWVQTQTMTQTRRLSAVPSNLRVFTRFCIRTLYPIWLLGSLGKICVATRWESKVMQLSIDNWSLHSTLTFSLPAVYWFSCVLGLKLIFTRQHRWIYCESISNEMKLLTYSDKKKNLCIGDWSHDNPACKSIRCYLQRGFKLQVQKLLKHNFWGFLIC